MQKIIKKVLCIILTIAITVVAVLADKQVTFAAAVGMLEFDGGEGTEENPYKISSVDQFNEIRNHLEVCFVLTDDIDFDKLNNGVWVPIGTESNPFTGTLDGAGHVIFNIKGFESPTKNACGLFAHVLNANLKNIHVRNSEEITIICKSNYKMKAGILASCGTANIFGCSVKANLIGKGDGVNLGLLVGNVGGKIENSYSEGTVYGDCSDIFPLAEYVGGIAGISSAVIENCYSKAIVNAKASSGAGTCSVYIGGIVGQYSADENNYIRNVYYAGTINNYSAFSREKINGIVGNLTAGRIENSYYDQELAGLKTDDEYARMTSQMEQFYTYADWDFNSIWCRNEYNDGYPFLRDNCPEEIWKTRGNIIKVEELPEVSIRELFEQYPQYIGKCYIDTIMGRVFDECTETLHDFSGGELFLASYKKILEDKVSIKSFMKLLFERFLKKDYRDAMDKATYEFVKIAVNNDEFMSIFCDELYQDNKSIKELVEYVELGEKVFEQSEFIKKLKKTHQFSNEDIEKIYKKPSDKEKERLGLDTPFKFAEFVLMMCVIKEINTEFIITLKSYIIDNSDLYESLDRLSSESDLVYRYVRDEILSEGFDLVKKRIFKLAKVKDIKLVSKVGSEILKVCGKAIPGCDADEYVEATLYYSLVANICASMDFQQKNLIIKVRSGEQIDVDEELAKLNILFNSEVAALQCFLDATEKIAKGLRKNTLQYCNSTYMKMLNYNTFLIESCRSAANETALSFTYEDGTAAVRGTMQMATENEEEVYAYSISRLGREAGIEEQNALTFPESISGYDVTKICDNAFENDSSIEVVIIPGNIKQIGKRAFANMTNLKVVIIEEGVEEIGEEAFAGCGQLDVVELPESIRVIGDRAFDDNIIISSPPNEAVEEYATNTPVFRNELTSNIDYITILNLPDKLVYNANDELNETGMSIEVTYHNGSVEAVSGGWLSTIADPQLGVNTVSVLYGNASTAYEVEIQPSEVSYTVKYLSASGSAIAESIEKSGMAGTVVSEVPVEIPGYSAVCESQEKELSIGKNEFIFYYYDNREDLGEALVSYENEITYTGQEICPKVDVTLDGCKLEPNRDYSLYYMNNLNVGKAFFVIIAQNRYKGILCYDFEIKPRSSSEEGGSSSGESGSNPEESGSSSGWGGSSGGTIIIQNPVEEDASNENTGESEDENIKVNGKTDLIGCSTILSYAETFYDGKTKTPGVLVRDGETILEEGKDYTLEYENNKEPGTASVIVNGIGNYEGQKVLSFIISLKKVQIKGVTNTSKGSTVKWCKVSGSGYCIYRKKSGSTKWVKIKTIKNDKTIQFTDTTVKNGTTYYYKVCAFFKNKDGSCVKSFKNCFLNAPRIVSKNAKSGKICISRNKQASGYEVQYSLSSKFVNSKKVLLKGNKTISAVLNGLKKGKRYYIRVRSYKTIGGKKFYSAWRITKLKK
ncbi:MAG: leucine-rich repeat protein [Lachnospiraceae bacterium]